MEKKFLLFLLSVVTLFFGSCDSGSDSTSQEYGRVTDELAGEMEAIIASFYLSPDEIMEKSPFTAAKTETDTTHANTVFIINEPSISIGGDIISLSTGNYEVRMINKVHSSYTFSDHSGNITGGVTILPMLVDSNMAILSGTASVTLDVTDSSITHIDLILDLKTGAMTYIAINGRHYLPADFEPYQT